MNAEKRKTARTSEHDLALDGTADRMLQHLDLPPVRTSGWDRFWDALHAAVGSESPRATPPIVYGQGDYRHDGNGRLIDKEA